MAFSLQSAGDSWTYNVWELDNESGQPLALMAFKLLKDSGLISMFRLNEAKLVAFLHTIEEGYPNNPYHNRYEKTLRNCPPFPVLRFINLGL